MRITKRNHVARRAGGLGTPTILVEGKMSYMRAQLHGWGVRLFCDHGNKVRLYVDLTEDEVNEVINLIFGKTE